VSGRLEEHVRADLPGRFSEADMLRRQWSLVAATLEGAVLPPYEVLIHPSSSCNLRCQWCIGDHVPLELWSDERAPPLILDASKSAADRLPDRLAVPENLANLIEDLIAYRVWAPVPPDGAPDEFRVQNVSFSGLIGEPFAARKALVPALRRLAGAGMRTGVFTNGVLLDDDAVDAVMGIAYVHLSLDAASPTTYARLKLGGRSIGELRFRQAVANLRKLCEERRRRAGCDLEINVSFVLYPDNYTEVLDAARLVHGLGVDALRLKQDISGDRTLSRAQRREASELVARAREELESETFRVIEIHRLERHDESARRFSACRITNLMAAVGSDGCLYPCNYHPRPGGATYGDAITEGFRAVWEGARRRELRNRLPAICPKVCDPFKNRSNELLEAADAVAATSGLRVLRSEVAALPHVR
jgi:MoaA/NifB/PqqE/SkfB family radical SAM enzyme